MIDLHIHTTYSDGTWSLKEILKEAEKLNLKYISITDHDSCLAYKELEKMDIKKYYSGKIIKGIEIKSAYRGRTIDLLGYNIDTERMQKWMNEFYKDKNRAEMQIKYFKQLYEVCMKKNLKMTPIDEIKWNPNNDWAKVRIYEDLKKYEENKSKVPADFWEDFITFNKKYCCDFNSEFYIDKSKDYPSLENTINIIHECGGVAIIAHAFIYKWAKDKEEFIRDLKENYNTDGFECYHSEFKSEESHYLSNYCKENNLLMSGGSDFHGDNKPDINLGIGKGNLKISEEIIQKWI